MEFVLLFHFVLLSRRTKLSRIILSDSSVLSGLVAVKVKLCCALYMKTKLSSLVLSSSFNEYKWVLILF